MSENEATAVEIELSTRAIKLPLIGNINAEAKEKLEVPQVEVSGDNSTDLQAIVNLFDGDMEDLFVAANDGRVAQARSEWHEKK